MRLLFQLITIILIVASAFSAFMFHQSYWRFRDVFNKNGRYFDAETGMVYHAQTGIGWALIGAATFVIALFLYWRSRQ